MSEIFFNEIEVETVNPFQLPVCPVPQRSQLPSIGAIYFVISKNGDLLYIGQTGNLKTRWHKHECGINLESPKETNITWLAVEDLQQRIKLERLLIQKFKPPLNWISRIVKNKKILQSNQMKTRKKQNKPTAAELEILSVLWELGQATVKEIHEVLNLSKPTTYTTVLKFLQIMTEKGLVERDDANRAHVYRAASSQEQTQKTLVSDLLEKAFRGSALRLVQHVLEAKPASAEDLKEIRRMISQAEKKGETK